MEIIAVLSDISLVNDKINKIEQICVEANAASDRNDTKELLNIVKKLKHGGDQLTEHLGQIFNMFLHSEEAPVQWKKASYHHSNP